jgi:hypothetical protein
MKIAGMLIAMVLSGCVIETDDDGGPTESGGSTSETYNNHVKLECNGSVLLDRTFTSKSECESFRESNTYTCGPIELSFSC